jgi:hypothetical protein
MDQRAPKVHKELLGFQDLTDQLDQQVLKEVHKELKVLQVSKELKELVEDKVLKVRKDLHQ